MNFKIGDLVTRNSYNNDIVFKIINISDSIAYLKGTNIRLYADSKLDDLKIYDKQDIDDYRETVEAVKKDLDKMDIDEAVVFMGHGTEHESHSSYPAIEYMFRDYGINAFVGTVEGYPELEQVIKKLKNRNIKTVDLLPFMLVAGDHAINDMASDEEDSWKTILEKEGFNVKVHVKGLGENPYIQEKFKNHALDCMKELQEASI